VSALALEMPASSLPLRHYQAQAIEAINSAHARGVTRPLVVLPTGGGKTVVFSHLVSQRPGRSLILAHRDELINQAAAKLTAVSGSLDVGIVKAARDDADARVVVASVQTLARPGRAERLGKFSTIIVDEAHHAVADIYLDVLGRLGSMASNGPLTCGFTATAGRSDKVGLGAVWQEIAYQRGIIQMIAEGYLCDVRAMQIGGDFNLGNAQVKAGDYTDSSLAAELERSDALNAAADAYVRYAKDRPGVAFTPTIATAHALAEALTRKGVRSEAVDGTMPMEQRRAILARLHRGETQVVPNAQVLTEGWDEPAVSCALMLRPTKSAPLFAQMAGRVLRPFVGKEDALILDMCGSADQLGLATIADLAGMAPGSVKNGKSLLDAADDAAAADMQRHAVGAAQTKQVELLRRSGLRWLDVSGAWVLPVGSDQTMILTRLPGDGTEDAWDVYRCQKGASPLLESGKPLSLDWARGVGEEVARAHGSTLSQADAPWRKRPVSDAQRGALERMGYADRLSGLTRGGASDLMTAYDAAKSIRKLPRRGALCRGLALTTDSTTTRRCSLFLSMTTGRRRSACGLSALRGRIATPGGRARRRVGSPTACRAGISGCSGGVQPNCWLTSIYGK
jgi:superfamily II DNA or RNA helicase